MTNEINKEAEAMREESRRLINESATASPPKLAEINISLTAIKSYFSEKLDNILIFKAGRLEDLRTELKTSAAAKFKWNSTEEGKNEIILRGIIGRIKDQISVNKSRLNVYHDETWGAY